MHGWKGSWKQMRIKYKLNLSAGCLAVLGAIILFLIIPSQVGLETQSVQGITSRSLPYALCVLMAVCGAGLIVQSLILKKDEVKELEIKQEVKGICYMLLLLVYGYGFSRSFLVSTLFWERLHWLSRNVKKFPIMQLSLLQLWLCTLYLPVCFMSDYLRKRREEWYGTGCFCIGSIADHRKLYIS